jgi:hypothetical protein
MNTIWRLQKGSTDRTSRSEKQIDDLNTESILKMGNRNDLENP